MTKTIELFCGTKSFSKVAKAFGYETFTIDNDKQHNPTICCDILKVPIIQKFNILWASPPCTTFSVASISTHWKGGKEAYIPKSKECIIGLKLLDKTIKIISKSKPKYWFIENPRGVMRKVIDKIFKKYNISNYKRETICYCRYGDKRMKPTDIWTNCSEWKPKDKLCFNGCDDHEKAPRGSKTGTQGLKGSKERGIIPSALFKEIFKQLTGMSSEELKEVLR